MTGAMHYFDEADATTISEINITPLVDIVLVKMAARAEVATRRSISKRYPEPASTPTFTSRLRLATNGKPGVAACASSPRCCFSSKSRGYRLTASVRIRVTLFEIHRTDFPSRGK